MARFSITSLEYGKCPVFPKSSALYLYGGQETMETLWAYYLVQGEDHNILVDCGFGGGEYQQKIGREGGVSQWTSPESVLREIGLSPLDIDAILVTHIHYDHFGAVDAFPNATVYVQAREVSEWLRWMAMPKRLQMFTPFVDPLSMVSIAQLAAERRLRLLEGDVEDVLPGIDVRAAYDTHTYGSMWVIVKEVGAGQSWVIAGDNVLSYENLEGVGGDGVLRPVGYALGSQSNLLLAMDEMLKTVDDDVKRIVPGHEIRLTEEYATRIGKNGMRITELSRASGADSLADR
jgi:N-acyl homoserine lactone hydrolase